MLLSNLLRLSRRGRTRSFHLVDDLTRPRSCSLEFPLTQRPFGTLHEEALRLYKQRDAFLEGRSGPDFASMDFEVDFKGRATVEDLTDLGRAQMGF